MLEAARKGYGIICTRKDGSQFYISGSGSAFGFWFNRKEAVAYKKELKAHIKSGMKVIRVVLEMRPVIQGALA